MPTWEQDEVVDLSENWSPLNEDQPLTLEEVRRELEPALKQGSKEIAAREHLQKSPIGELAAAGVSTAAGIAGPVARTLGTIGIPGATEFADEANRLATAYSRAAGDIDVEQYETGETVVPPVLAQAGRGVLQTVPQMIAAGGLGGASAPIFLAGVQEGERAITEAKDAGFEGADVAIYSGARALNEAAWAAAFQRIGLGGAESQAARLMAREGARQTLKEVVKQGGKDILHEIPEEIFTEVSHSLIAAYSGVDPSAMTPENLQKTLVATAAQTILGGAGLQTPQIGVAAYDKLRGRKPDAPAPAAGTPDVAAPTTTDTTAPAPETAAQPPETISDTLSPIDEPEPEITTEDLNTLFDAGYTPDELNEMEPGDIIDALAELQIDTAEDGPAPREVSRDDIATLLGSGMTPAEIGALSPDEVFAAVESLQARQEGARLGSDDILSGLAAEQPATAPETSITADEEVPETVVVAPDAPGSRWWGKQPLAGVVAKRRLGQRPEVPAPQEPVTVDAIESPDLKVIRRREEEARLRREAMVNFQPGDAVRHKKHGTPYTITGTSGEGLVTARFEDGRTISGLDPRELEKVEPAAPAEPKKLGGKSDSLSPKPQFEIKEADGKLTFEAKSDGKKIGEGFADVKGDKLVARLVFVKKENRRGGLAIDLMERLYQHAQERGLQLVSDETLTKDAVKLVEEMERRGYTVTKNPKAEWKNDKLTVPPGEFVFTVTKPEAAPSAKAPSVKAGERIAFTKDGKELTGTVRSVDSVTGEATVSVEQVSQAGGVPIGRVEYVKPENIRPAAAAPAKRSLDEISEDDLAAEVGDVMSQETPADEATKIARELSKGFKVGDRVEWVNEQAEALTGKVRAIPGSMPGRLQVDVTTATGSTPTGRVEYPRAERVRKVEKPTPAKKLGKKKTLAEKKAEADQEVADAFAEFKHLLEDRGIASNPFADPVLVRAASKLTAKLVKKGIIDFAVFMDTARQYLGDELTRKITPLLERGWNHIRETYNVPGMTEATATPAPAAAPADVSPAVSLSRQVAELLDNGQKVGDSEFFRMADEAFGGKRTEGAYGDSQAYDALESAVNQHLRDLSIANPQVPAAVAKRNATLLSEASAGVPRHKARTGEKDTLQQFSTPPAYAYAAVWAANIQPSDVVLEPSAGTGGLAVHAMNTDAKVYVNEIDESRVELLKQLEPDGIFTEDAEHIDAILKGKMPAPTVVVMNPPFSRAGRRMGNKRVIGTDRKHIDAALKLLAPNGRLVAIMGLGTGFGKGEGKGLNNWLNGLQYSVRANIEVGRDVYKGHGTAFPTRLLVIDKVPRSGETVTAVADTMSDLIDVLNEVRNDRPEPASIKPTGESSFDETRGDSAEQPAIQPPTGGVGPGEQTGLAGQPSAPDSLGDQAEPVEGERPAEVTSAPAKPGGRKLGGKRGGATRKPGKPDGAGEAGRPGVDAGREPVREPGAGVSGPAEAQRPVEIEQTERQTRKELGDSTYETYQPSVKFKGAQKHPASIVESAAMSAVQPPAITYQPHIPENVVHGYTAEDGTQVGISDLQLEAVAYAGHAHSQIMPNGERRGFMVGDGTGVGKAREASGIILDNFHQGRRKAVWISKNIGLMDTARVEWARVGGDPALVKEHGKVKSGEGIAHNEGILFTTYTTISQQASDAAKAVGKTKSRLEQIVEWLGEDFDGVVVMDEAHEMGNAIGGGTGRFKKKAARKAVLSVELQNRLPKARVVYFSATAATEVENLAYATRLGLWGEGTPFANRERFVNEISEGGVAAMEKTAADMKALGVYMARNISFNDGTEKGTVTYDRLEHTLTEDQRTSHGKMAEAWRVVFGNMNEAMEITQAAKSSDRGNRLGQFWAANQRFWNQVVTAMQTPAVLQAIEKDLAEGRSAVIQLTNTNEAAQKRALASNREEDDLDMVDVSPKYILMDYVERSFPTQKYEEYLDENGNTQFRPVFDSDKNPVHDPEALAMKEKLLGELGSLQVANRSALDMVIDKFGEDMVSEVTGRTERLVKRGGKLERQKLTKRGRKADIDSFMDGRKRVLIFSDAGGTGASYHADLSRRNQQKRVHYLLQAGWRADVAIQGLGRSHRSNQAEAPKYVLVHTDLKGQKRFISTIARRLSQLGALTKGQRQAGESGVFSAADNLESTEAREALHNFWEDVVRGQIPEVTISYVRDVMGLELIDKKNGGIRADLPPVPQFMNRVLSLPIDDQNKIFDEFSKRLEAKVTQAIAQGTLDQGMETLKADRIQKISEQVAYVDPSGAETKHVVFKVYRKTKPLSWDQAQNKRIRGFVKSQKTGKVWIVEETGITEQDDRGRIQKKMRMVGPMGTNYNTESALDERQHWEKLTKDDAKALWDEQVASTPEFHEQEMHMLSGVLLPIWDRMPKGSAQVKRLLTEDGEQFLGRVIEKKDIAKVLKNLGVAIEAPKISSEEAISKVVDEGATLVLANDWKIKRTTVEGERAIEIRGPQFSHNDELRRQGVNWRRIGYDTRYFIPMGEEAAAVLERVTKNRPIVEITGLDDPGETGVLHAMADKRRPITRQSRTATATAPDDAAEKPTAAADIIKTWERMFDVPIRVGGFSKRAAGIYKVLPEVVRVQENHVGNLAVAAHEVAHHIDKETEISKGLPEHLANELAGLDYEPKGRVFEGFAEFVRHYITETDAETAAPQFHDWFVNTWMGTHPEWATKLLQARTHARAFANQSVFQRIRSMIGYRPGDDLDFKARWSQKIQSFAGRQHRLWVDKFSPLKTIEEEAKARGREGLGPYEAAMGYFMSAGPNASKAAEVGVHSIRDGRKLGSGKSIAGMARHLKNDAEYDEAIAYTYARHTIHQEAENPGYNTGLDIEDAEAWIKEVQKDPDKHQRFEKFAEDLADINNDMLEMLVDAGALTAEEKARMMKRYGRFYMPLHRVQDDKRFRDGMFAGSKFINLPDPIRGRSRAGSGRQIIDPLDATISRMIHFYGRAAQARVEHTLVETVVPQFGGEEGMGGFIDVIDPKKIVHQGTIEEILGTLRDEGIVDADMMRAMRIASAIRLGNSDILSPSDWKWFGARHGLDIDRDPFSAFAEAAQQEPDALATISLWRPDYTPSARKATTFYRRGDKTYMLQWDRELYDTASGMDEIQFRGFVRIMRGASQWFKAGAVGLSTGFGAANLLRDYFEYQGKAEHVQGLKSLGKPPEMLARYVANKALRYAGKPADDALIDLFEEAGGKLYTRLGADAPSRTRTRRRMLAKSTMSAIGISLESPKEFAAGGFEFLQDIMAITDAPPRLAEMEGYLLKEGYEHRGGDWYHNGRKVQSLPEDVRIRAINAAGEATVNFKRVGAIGRHVDSFLPFFNAAVQATYRQAIQLRNVRKLGEKGAEGDAARRALVYFAGLAAASAAYWWYRNDDDDYREMEPWLKDGYWSWGANGKTYIRIPKPRDAAIVANVTEAMLDGWYHDDEHPASDVMWNDFVGRVPTGGGASRGLVETFVANRDYFRGRELTPSYLEDLPKEMQFTPYTLETSKTLAPVLSKYATPMFDISPIQFEHLLNSASGGAYRRMTDAAETAISEGRLGPEQWPVVRGVVINRHQARSLDDFYREWGQTKLDAKREELSDGVSAEMTQKLDRLDDYAALMTEIRKRDKRDSKGRRKFLYEPYLVGLAREALGRPPLENNPTPFAADAPAEIKDVVVDFARRRAETVIVSKRFPQKVHKGDASYAETIKTWKAGRDADKRWLDDHKDSPAVQEAISHVLRSSTFQAIRRGDGQPHWDPKKETVADYQTRAENWWKIRQDAMAWFAE